LAVIFAIFVLSRRRPAVQSNALEVDVAMNSVMTRHERRAAARKRSEELLAARRRLSDESSLFGYGQAEESS
jgi:PiT family inorganic phosphate transporter